MKEYAQLVEMNVSEIEETFESLISKIIPNAPKIFVENAFHAMFHVSMLDVSSEKCIISILRQKEMGFTFNLKLDPVLKKYLNDIFVLQNSDDRITSLKHIYYVVLKAHGHESPEHLLFDDLFSFSERLWNENVCGHFEYDVKEAYIYFQVHIPWPK